MGWQITARFEWSRKSKPPSGNSTAPNLERLLGVPQLPSGIGVEMSSIVFDNLEKWSLLDKVKGFVFDKIASNTGRLNGACTLLGQRLSRKVLYLAFRHHIFEFILQAAMDENCIGYQTQILLFLKDLNMNGRKEGS